MICMRCHRPMKQAYAAGMGPTCARIVLGLLTRKNEKAQEKDARQVDWVEAAAA